MSEMSKGVFTFVVWPSWSGPEIYLFLIGLAFTLSFLKLNPKIKYRRQKDIITT